MEQSQFLMWMKKRNILRSQFEATMATYNDSWEEKAFVDDAAGRFGGCIWPPRSYSCSFCKREFRSAQALGGHMNVHRRDRARLKQSLISPHDDDDDEIINLHDRHNQNHNQNIKSSDLHFPFGFCKSDPNSTSSLTFVDPTIPTSRVSALSTQENQNDEPLVSSYNFPSILQELQKRSDSNRVFNISNSNVGTNAKSLIEEESIRVGHDDFVETNLSIGLTSLANQSRINVYKALKRPAGSCGDEAVNSCKRAKTDISKLPFFISSADHKNYLPLEVLAIKSSSMEDLDLELRLGDPPKVQ